MLHKKEKKAQEEMIGFALIIIIVAVILLAFLFLSSGDSGEENLDSYQVNSFLQSYLKYTTSCKDDSFSGNKTIQDLILDIDAGPGSTDCEGQSNNAKDVLENTSKEILNASWPVGPKRPTKGYKLEITQTSDNNPQPLIGVIERGMEESNATNIRGGKQDFSRGGSDYDITFKIFS